jgi:hypothetical protein
MSDGYQYDVFVSYLRNSPQKNWVLGHFLRLFKGHLEDALGRPANIFLDTVEIGPGDVWPARLKSALAHTRCLVAIWQPMYFQSIWCQRELATMLYRSRQLGYGAPDHPRSLIFPINVRDGDRFPEYARSINWLDCKEVARDCDYITKSERFLVFEDNLVKWTDKMADAIENVPSWNGVWATEEWFDNAIKTILVEPDRPIPPFRLPEL